MWIGNIRRTTGTSLPRIHITFDSGADRVERTRGLVAVLRSPRRSYEREAYDHRRAVEQGERMFMLMVTAIGAFTYLAVPRLGFWLAGQPSPSRARWLPVAATVVFALAWHLPTAQVSAGSETFLLHAVGGGVSVTMIAYFVALNLGITNAWTRAALAFAMVSVLGTVNEVFELFYDRIVGTNLTADTASDLLANTAGAAAAVLLCEVLRTIWPEPSR